MIINEGLDFIKDYVGSINEIIKSKSPDQKLSRLQCNWLGFIILGLLVTNSLCWSKFARFSIGKYIASSICCMFKKASIAW